MERKTIRKAVIGVGLLAVVALAAPRSADAYVSVSVGIPGVGFSFGLPAPVFYAPPVAYYPGYYGGPAYYRPYYYGPRYYRGYYGPRYGRPYRGYYGRPYRRY